MLKMYLLLFQAVVAAIISAVRVCTAVEAQVPNSAKETIVASVSDSAAETLDHVKIIFL